MNKLSVLLVSLSVLTLAACQTSSLSEDEKRAPEASVTSVSGRVLEVDEAQSVVSFVGKSNIVNHEGKFNDFSVSIKQDPESPADLEKATIEVVIDIASVEVDSDGLRNHLLQEEFFNAEAFPQATFRSTSIENISGNRYKISGEMTLKGKTEPLTMTADITDDYLTATFDIMRATYGIGNDAYGQKLLDPAVPVQVKLVFKK